MKIRKTAWVMITAMLLSAVAAMAQDGMPPMPRNDERWKELQSYRIWAIIQKLDLDARSERGIAILDVINNNAEDSRQLLLDTQEKRSALHNALEAEPVDENKVTELIGEIESLQKQLLQTQLTYQERLQELLTPLERAKLMMAEDYFRQRLRKAMQGRGHGRRGPGGPPESKKEDIPEQLQEMR